ncbi:ABC transporter ATP-binding protein [Caballeronia sp. LP006]|jgi:NitT/TauT family transport system ATP-binding protein|uniref:ABC transporter ATP-binding protein n=1 Tax=unclassified Caballeronia TaxID=2646786 RepID=UPI0020298AEC|nr:MULTISPECIES: ABC transporter ATP-binding protein [unclassified Caballeronia]MDR5777227.1 ABC transporter ATP-binding protein [Caballeronia sp. LZ002]MDR5826453.1 ABC transporter ATP-binding protein [Caballeronia sp. LP006]MDR5852665.1 ABC transporter ATP-binding protein [Caballeronia sp. LZ003]
MPTSVHDDITPAGVPIRIESVSKTFGEDTEKPFRALKPINMNIEAGEFVSVVGPSGCGKSTLMLMVAGLLARSDGTIVVGDRTVDRPVTDVGIAFQDHLLLDFRTAMENVLLQADIRGLPRDRIEARARELFNQLRLQPAVDKYPRQLSGGMRQRVSLIRTLVHDPSLILMDEPFGALDALTRLQVRMDLEALWMRRRPTVLFITHSVEEAVGLSDRIFVMSPTPGEVVDEIVVELPRPRPIVLGDAPEFARYVDSIYGHFARMGVLRGIDVPRSRSEQT